MPTPEIRPEIEDLSLAPLSRKLPAYDARSPMRLMAFWRGCLEAREQVMGQATDDYERSSHVAAIARIEAIMEGLQAGRDLADIPEYQRWLAYGP